MVHDSTIWKEPAANIVGPISKKRSTCGQWQQKAPAAMMIGLRETKTKASAARRTGQRNKSKSACGQEGG